MYYPRMVDKSDVFLGLTMAAAVLASGLAMNKMTVGVPNLGLLIAPALDGWQAPEIVSQNAISPSASPDMPAIAVAASPASPEPVALAGATDAVCPLSLELLDEGNAMIGGTLLAPCLPDTEVVIAHAGMVFTAKTLATGALFFTLPALKTDGQVDIRFTSGETASAALPMPDAASLQRVAVQWPYQDGFTIHAFENGAAFGDAGHIWAENLNAPDVAAPAKGGYLTVLGDASVDMPLMAQVYTYGGNTPTEVLFEAAVTASNCAGEVMGDALYAKAGAVEKSEISIAMPDCDAVGEYVHLGFVPPSPALAMAN